MIEINGTSYRNGLSAWWALAGLYDHRRAATIKLDVPATDDLRAQLDEMIHEYESPQAALDRQTMTGGNALRALRELRQLCA